jgi:hypothetical protein
VSSFLLGQAGDPASLSGLLVANDYRASPPSYQPDKVAVARSRPWEDGKLWPRSRMLGSDSTAMIVGMDAQFSGRWGEMAEESGSQTMLKFRGTTRDSTSAPLPQCVVLAYLAASGQLVGQVTSDNGGYFELPTQFTPDPHYLVSYKAGSPDVAGTTLNTLTAS